MHVLVNTKEQISALISSEYNVDRVYVETGSFWDDPDILDSLKDRNVYLACPHILRENDKQLLDKALRSFDFDGILVRTLEELSFIENCNDHKIKDIVLDSSMYILNSESLDFYLDTFKENITEYYMSYELNRKEIRTLVQNVSKKNNNIHQSLVSYGRIPMMVSSNCTKKTLDNCNKKREFTSLMDRTNTYFPVFSNCLFCHNVIYNSVPLSLHGYKEDFDEFDNIRLDFTNESYDKTLNILELYNSLTDVKTDFEYTTGHYKRGIE